MNAYVFSTLAKAMAFAAVVDGQMAYPHAGKNIGGGVHVLAAQGQTTTYAPVLAHPTLVEWAYPIDTTVTSVVGPNAVTLGVGAPTALDTTWYPPTISASAIADAGAPDAGLRDASIAIP